MEMYIYHRATYLFYYFFSSKYNHLNYTPAKCPYLLLETFFTRCYGLLPVCAALFAQNYLYGTLKKSLKNATESELARKILL